jgi:hypothetical protein
MDAIQQWQLRSQLISAEVNNESADDREWRLAHDASLGELFADRWEPFAVNVVSGSVYRVWLRRLSET